MRASTSLRSSNAGSCPGFGDEVGDDLVVAPAVSLDPSPRTPRPEVTPQCRGHHRHPRCQRDHRRKQLPQFVERAALCAEHGAQDGVEGDAHHRLQRFELPALRPGLRSRASLLLRRSLRSRPSACRGTAARAACAVRGARRRRRLKVEPGPSTVPRLDARPTRSPLVVNRSLINAGSLITSGLAEDRQVQRERAAVAPAHRGDRTMPRGEEGDAHDSLRYPRPGRQSHRIRRRLSHVAPSALVLQGTVYGTRSYRRRQPPCTCAQ